MSFVYVGSTYPLFLGLYLAEKGESITFLYTRDRYRVLFDSLDHKSIHLDASLRFVDLFNLRILRQRIKDFNNIVKQEELVFTHYQYADLLFLFLFNRIKDSRSVFYDLEPLANNSVTLDILFKSYKNFIRVVLSRILFKMLYNTPLKIQFYAKSFYLALDKTKLAKFGIEQRCIGMSNEELAVHVARYTSISSVSVNFLYIAGPEFKETSKMFNLKSIYELEKFLKVLDIPIKPHPSGYKTPATSLQVSDSIPTELLFNSIKNGIISICSTSLISASHFFINSNVKVICLAELVNWIDEDSRQDQIERIKERGLKNIYFPNTFHDLSLLLT